MTNITFNLGFQKLYAHNVVVIPTPSFFCHPKILLESKRDSKLSNLSLFAGILEALISSQNMYLSFCNYESDHFTVWLLVIFTI